ncbi:MAG: OmpA family protein [Crocinitomicaceae bacterium]|nr:OmpA family protein [Crocinitomicaceae bacterium]
MRLLQLFFILLFSTQLAFSQTYQVMETVMTGSMSDIKEINSEGIDFAPFVSGNKLYFTSSREYDVINLGENNWKNGGYLNIYSAEFKGEISAESKFKDVELVSEKLKGESHTGPVSFSVTGDTMFFTQVIVNQKKNKKNKFRPQLFMAVRDGNQWTNIQALPFNDNTFSFGHPCYDSKNQRLYFASDMTGGAGQKDIYYADLKSGTWSAPVNMKEINSSANEIYPFVIEGHLFFASDRESGVGGLDIYWKNLSQPNDAVETVNDLNTPSDDFGIFIFPGMKTGYISSNKSGNDDIYFLNIEKKVTIRNDLAGMFTYRNLNGEASGLKVQVVGEDDLVLDETTTDEKGEFIFKNLNIDGSYTLRVITEEELNLVIYDENGNPVVDLVTDENGEFTYKKLEFTSSGIPGLIPENMIEPGDDFGHLSGQLIYEDVPGEYPANVAVMLYDEDGNLKFKQVTDNTGNFDFKQLSMDESYILKVEETDEEFVLLIFDQYGNVVAQLKANEEGEFVYRKLNGDHVKGLPLLEETEDLFELETQTIAGYFEYDHLNGISPEGLTIYAYSDDGILLAETQTDQKGEFRFRSLPVETNILFKIDESDPDLKLDDFTLYIYDRYGKKVAGLSRGQNGYFIYKPLGFQQSNLSQIDEDSLDIDLALTTNYDIINVYFDSNKANVKSDDLDELNKLYNLLKANPNLRMEINAYADARASDDYNLILSQKRGDWIVDYMVKKGIPASRFIVNAYGETKLVDESNDAVNRRAEIRLY